MSKTGPIILVDDDPEDKEIFELIISDLGIGNRLIYFDRCDDALHYLLTTREQPFIIFCDVNLPAKTGIEFKKEIDSTPKLRRKSIPFVFYSTSVDTGTVTRAYTEMTVQGFFQKASRVADMRKTIQLVLEYWFECRHPNS
ncbi:MAG TPA: response regulator [Bacteroidia bacterium]|nr:response regulator [Bacteroidia bacterium]